MDALTIVMTIVNRNESDEFCTKAADALAEIAAMPEFREGTYETGKTWTATNGVAVRADYKLAEGVEA